MVASDNLSGEIIINDLEIFAFLVHIIIFSQYMAPLAHIKKIVGIQQ